MSTRNYYQPNSILITGGLGFIGSNFIHYFSEKNPSTQIVNLDLCTYASNPENLSNLKNNKRYIEIHGDIADQELVSEILRRYHIDTIIHFAAESHVDRSIENPQSFIQSNIVGTHNLLEEAKSFWLIENHWNEQNCRFYHISTDEIFGSCPMGSAPFNETSPYKPCSPYSASKASSNHLVSAYHHTYRLPIVISNCSNNYGPRQHPEKLIPKIIQCCLNETPIPIYGDGSNIRDWLYVLDHCKAILCILQRGHNGEEYNIGANNERSNLEVTTQICELMDELHPRSKLKQEPYKNLIQFVKDRPGHDWRYSLDCKKLYHSLGFMPEVDFVAGLKNTIDYYLKIHISRKMVNEVY